MKKIINKTKFLFRVLKRKYQKKFIIQPYQKKREIILDYKKRFKCSNFVETGTFLGDTVESFKNTFENILSIELQTDLAKKAKERFNTYEHIEILEGDSAIILKERKELFSKNTLYWLDGHYSGEFYVGENYIKTAKGDKETPIIEELKEILKNGLANNVILIDDARCFTGQLDYPTKKQLKKLLNKLNVKNKQISVKQDIIRIIPE